jgi:hypothetical protein
MNDDPGGDDDFKLDSQNQEFMTVAAVTKGKWTGAYLGAIEWGQHLDYVASTILRWVVGGSSAVGPFWSGVRAAGTNIEPEAPNGTFRGLVDKTW